MNEYRARISPLVGKPWHHLARGPEAYDCVGLVQAVYGRQVNVPAEYPVLPDGETLIRMIQEAGFEQVWVRARDKKFGAPELTAGLLMALFIQVPRVPQHLAVWLGDGLMGHADMSSGVQVCSANRWSRHIHSTWKAPWHL